MDAAAADHPIYCKRRLFLATLRTADLTVTAYADLASLTVRETLEFARCAASCNVSSWPHTTHKIVLGFGSTLLHQSLSSALRCRKCQMGARPTNFSPVKEAQKLGAPSTKGESNSVHKKSTEWKLTEFSACP